MGAAVLALGLPATADAATFCVKKPGCTQANTFNTLGSALSAASSNGTTVRDRINVGPVSLTENATSSLTNEVDIVGSGRGRTILTSLTTGAKTALSLPEPTSTVSDMTFRPGATSASTGLELGGHASRIVATAVNASSGGQVAVKLRRGGTLEDSAVNMPGNQGTVGVQTVNAGGAMASAVVDRAQVTAQDPVQKLHPGPFHLRNARIVGRIGVLASTDGLDLYNVLVELRASGTGVGEEAGIGIQALADGASASADVDVKHTTVVNVAGQTGPGIEAFGQNGGTAHVGVRDTIVAGPGNHLGTTELTGGTASIDVDYSDYSSTVTAGGGTITPGVHNVDLSPGFLNAAARDYRLAHDSQLIDIGFPGAPQAGDLTVDLAGGPRFVDGNANGTVRRDMGAFEYGRRPPNAVATATPSQVTPGTLVTFGGSASNDPDGDAITRSWSFDDGGSSSQTNPKHAFATQGDHTATLTVTDVTGKTDTATATVRVRTNPLPDFPPVFLSASMTNRAFAVVPRKRKPPRGTRFRYRLSEKATVRIVIQRRRAGRRVGGRCVKPTRRNRRRPKCKRFVRRGTLRAPGKAGRNSKRFGGRIRGKALRRGRYRAVLRATDAAGHKAKPRRLAFRIVRRR